MTRLTELEDASPTVLVRVFPSLSAWTEKGAESFIERVEGLLAKKSVVSIGLSGGQTPVPFFFGGVKKNSLLARGDQIPDSLVLFRRTVRSS